MHSNALRDPQIPPDTKNKFGVTCLDALFLESVPVPPEQEKWCIDDSCPRHTAMHYVTHRSYRMQNKFGVTCLGALFMESILVPDEHEK
jgi:hypothetical protein